MSLKRVKITYPKAKNGMEVAISAKNMGYGNKVLPEMNNIAEKPTAVKDTLQPVPRDQANLEAEKNETVVTNADETGLPAHFKIGGKPHSQGGTPLDLPSGSFIFSNDKKMKIKDPDILKQFGMSEKKSGYTPAEISKKFDINKFRQVLADPNSDKLQKATAEKMIENFMGKLGKLSILQESKKGFPTGIPSIAMPYLQTNNVDPTHLVTGGGSDEQEQQLPEGKYGYNVVPELFRFNLQRYGGQPMEPVQSTFALGGEEEGDNPVAQRAYESLKRIKVTYPSLAKAALGKEIKNSDVAKSLGMSEDQVASLRETDPDKLERMYKASLGEKTPTGQDPSARLTAEEFLGGLKKLGIDAGKKTNAELQGELYDKADPFRKAYMWGVYGDTKQGSTGNTFKPFAPKRYADGSMESFADYKKRITSNPDMASKLPELLSKQKNAFTDSDLGARTAFLLGDINTPEENAPTFKYEKQAKDQTRLNDLERANVDVKNAPEDPASFWLQDIIKTAGAAGDYARIKKYMPRMATYDPYLPQATFYDPTRELAANAENATIASNAAASFAGPQALSGRLSQIQAQASTNAANILGKYNNMNVGVANQFENKDTGILNQFGQTRANRATALYDNNVIANQQYDNAKNMARQNLRQSIIDAITNRAQTQSLNSMYGDQYRVDPLTGGFTKFTKGRPFDPQQQQEDFLQTLEGHVKKHPYLFKENPELGKAYLEAMLGK